MNRVEQFLIKSFHSLNKFKKENSNIIILNSDKRKKTVLMDKTVYHSKMHEMLSDRDTYEIINLDPLDALIKRNTKLIDALYNQGRKN